MPEAWDRTGFVEVDQPDYITVPTKEFIDSTKEVIDHIRGILEFPDRLPRGVWLWYSDQMREQLGILNKAWDLGRNLEHLDYSYLDQKKGVK